MRRRNAARAEKRLLGSYACSHPQTAAPPEESDRPAVHDSTLRETAGRFLRWPRAKSLPVAASETCAPAQSTSAEVDLPGPESHLVRPPDQRRNASDPCDKDPLSAALGF